MPAPTTLGTPRSTFTPAGAPPRPLVAFQTHEKLISEVGRFERAVTALELERTRFDADEAELRGSNYAPDREARQLRELREAHEQTFAEKAAGMPDLGAAIAAQIENFHASHEGIEAMAMKGLDNPVRLIETARVATTGQLTALLTDAAARLAHGEIGLLRGIIARRDDLSVGERERFAGLIANTAPATIGPARELGKKVGMLRARLDIARLGGERKVPPGKRAALVYGFGG